MLISITSASSTTSTAPASPSSVVPSSSAGRMPAPSVVVPIIIGVCVRLMCFMVVMMSLDNQGYDWSHIPSAADLTLVMVVVFVVLLIVMMVVMIFVLMVA